METELSVSLNVLTEIRNWQSLYGLKRGNFRSYKKFCVRKSNKIRKKCKMGFNQGKKFSKEKMEKLLLSRDIWQSGTEYLFKKKNKNLPDPEPITQEQAEKLAISIGKIFLLMIERNFLVLAESKQSGGQIKKTTIKKKLRKALKLCEILIDRFSEYYSSKDKIELKVLQGLISSSYEMEKKDFKTSKENLLNVIVTIKNLQKGVSMIERAHLQDIVDGCKQNLRFCKFQLKEFDQDNEEEMLTGIEDKEQFERILQMRSNNQNLKKLIVFNEEMEIENADLLGVVNKIELLQKSLENSIGYEGEEQLYWDLMEVFDEAVKISKKNRNEAGNNLTLSGIWQKFEDYFEFQKQVYTLRKHLNTYVQYNQKNNSNESCIALNLKLLNDKTDKRPQEKSRLIENILENLRIVHELHNNSKECFKIYKGLELFLRTIKCLNISLLYYKNKMYKETLSMTHLTRTLCDELKNENNQFWSCLEQDCISFDDLFGKHRSRIEEEDDDENEERNKSSMKSFSMSGFMNDVSERLDKLVSENKILENISKVALYNQQQQEMESLNLDFMNDMNMSNIYTKSAEINSLFDLLAQNKPKIEDNEVSVKKNTHLDFVRLPPLNKLVPPKPIFLDVAYDFIGKLFIFFL